MAKLYFRHGTMNCGKSLDAIKVAHNYERQHKKVLLLKSSLDIRSQTGKMESRTGLSHSCIDINKDDNLYEILHCQILISTERIHCILIDEGQFLTSKQVKELALICDEENIPIIVYGLKNSYIDGELFEGSKALLYYANKIEEIKTTCMYCNNKATMNLRIINGKPVYSGEIINCGDIEQTEDYYIPVCRKHYYNPNM